jgi:hypothetical protein
MPSMSMRIDSGSCIPTIQTDFHPNRRWLGRDRLRSIPIGQIPRRCRRGPIELPRCSLHDPVLITTSNPASLLPSALAYRESGLSVLPAKKLAKRPSLPGWKNFQLRIPQERQVVEWFSKPEDASFEIITFCGQSYDRSRSRFRLDML